MTEKLKGVREVLNSLQLYLKSPKNRNNAFGNYKYRSGEDILEAAKEELKQDKYPKNCTIVSQPSLLAIEGRLFMNVSTALNVDGEEVVVDGLAEHGKDQKGMVPAQLTGSTATFAKKYSLQNLFQLDESQDDPDANEKPEDDAKKAPKAPKLTDAEKAARAQTFFAKLKKEIEACKSLEAVKTLEEVNKDAIKRLEKHGTLQSMILQAIDTMKAGFIGTDAANPIKTQE